MAFVILKMEEYLIYLNQLTYAIVRTRKINKIRESPRNEVIANYLEKPDDWSKSNRIDRSSKKCILHVVQYRIADGF